MKNVCVSGGQLAQQQQHFSARNEAVARHHADRCVIMLQLAPTLQTRV